MKNFLNAIAKIFESNPENYGVELFEGSVIGEICHDLPAEQKLYKELALAA